MAQTIKFPEEKGYHQTALKGANAAAGLINSNHAGADLDDVAVGHRGHAHPSEQLDHDGGARPRQILNDWLLNGRWPGYGNEKETNRKRQLPQPASSLAQVNRTERKPDGFDAERPLNGSPFRGSGFDQAGWQVEKGKQREEQDHGPLTTDHGPRTLQG